MSKVVYLKIKYREKNGMKIGTQIEFCRTLPNSNNEQILAVKKLNPEKIVEDIEFGTLQEFFVIERKKI